MAIGARFSDHPSIKTDPPYWAGEKFAEKATSLINASLLEPTIPNLQFWGIMSCLEYGRASGSKAWTYGGVAVRMCQELTLHKEETLKVPITAPDGTVDYVAMALRRRIFWSCFCIDKFSSTSTNRPQGFEIGDYDAELPTLAESKLLRDPLQSYTVDKVMIDDDPLMNSITKYLGVLEIFGDIVKFMSRTKTDSSSVIWPPIKEHEEMSQKMRQWAEGLPEIYQFTPANVKLYRKTASQNYLNYWLCSHAMYCAGMLSLHRGSLAYSDISPNELSADTYERIQRSITLCKEHVEIAMEVFSKLRDYCGYNVLPYIGYAAYIFATVLMTSTFSSDQASYNKSSSGLAILYDTIKLLRPYWPVGERLAITTNDMLSTHSRLYEGQDQDLKYKQKEREFTDGNNNLQNSPVTEPVILPPSIPSPMITTSAPSSGLPYSFVSNSIPPYTYNQQLLGVNGNEINFNSCEFLNDPALFGQMILDTSKPPQVTSNMLSYYPPMTTNTNTSSYPDVTPIYQPFSSFSFQQQPPHHQQ
ncbi:hypothetical protein RO3G_07437 [Rhizopus delemar RA 99-880]|uniref:Xylanolytic transcriptional activator regulatory domain-containing protein n=3 Tax=Rhizopus TaxID=4842 RepID=I1C2Q2_RHIO9|nr:hypothetical protein RO3G_07437 [Rhizopus delemar RA 99-880]|eukprot:EIE82732.1 hypothetical protein RO3G_07437 [Rhizopus delemar RA 99-880]